MKFFIEYTIEELYPDLIVPWTPLWRKVYVGRISHILNAFTSWQEFPTRDGYGNVVFPLRFGKLEDATQFLNSFDTLEEFFDKFYKTKTASRYYRTSEK